ncbi:hypothetical protein AALI21_08620 [Corynebacteriaceae bacterium 6-324]
MKNYKALIRQASLGVNVLRDMVQLSPYDMAADGWALSTAKKFSKLADVFFGSTDSPRLQRESVALAEERGLSMERLQMIDSHAQKLKKRCCCKLAFSTKTADPVPALRCTLTNS